MLYFDSALAGTMYVKALWYYHTVPCY